MIEDSADDVGLGEEADHTHGAGASGTDHGVDFVDAAEQIYSPFVFVACGLSLALVALCFAEVASGFARTGGPVRYARVALGRRARLRTTAWRNLP
jgi:amino acid transporter